MRLKQQTKENLILLLISIIVGSVIMYGWYLIANGYIKF